MEEETKSENIEKTADPTAFTPTYKVLELNESEKSKYKFGSKAEKIVEAKRLKAEGNSFFVQKDYKKALSSYSRIFLYVNGFIGKEDPNYVYVKEEESKLTSEEKLDVDELKFTTYLNMAQIDLFNKKFPKCIERCNKAIAIKENVKAYYRRGCAYMELNDIDLARNDFDKVKKLDPSFKEIEEKYAVLKEKEKKFDNALKSKLKNMFN